MLRSSIASCFAILIAMPALAGTNFTAKLAEPVSESTEFIANKAIWSCEGETCAAELRRKTPTVRSCKKVAREIGKLAAFSSERGELGAEDLAACNTAAKD